MVKYPFVKQTGLKECAAACVQMILKYYDGYVSLYKLSQMLCTNNNGTTAFHIVEVLNDLGFKSAGYKYKNFYSLKPPCIMHVNINCYNHYVVVYKINFKKRKLLIADPSKGIYYISFSEFEKIWTGVTIKAKPIQKIVKEKEPKIKEFIFYLIRPNIKIIILISLLSLLISITSILLSFFMQAVITYINTQILFYIILFFIIIFFLKIILTFVRNILLINFNIKIDKKLFIETFNHIIHLPYHYSKNKTSGEIISNFNDLSLIKKVISYFSVSILIDVPLIIILIFILLYIDYHLFIINIFNIILYLILYLFYRKKNYYLLDETLRKKATVNSFIAESINGYETIKNINIEKEILNKFKQKYFNYIKIIEKTDKTYNIQTLLKDVINSIATLSIILYGIINFNKTINMSMFITIFLLSNLLNSSFIHILEFNYEIQEVISAINHIQELYLYENEKKILDISGDIKLKKLSFSFDKVKTVLENINLNIPCGTKMLVAGSSGSGKSTLFKIIKGYYENYEGLVLINNVNVKNALIKKLIYVSENEILFTGRVIDNLKITKKFKSNTKNMCELSSFIKDYNNIILENGFNLSCGQRQRIILARALSSFDIIIIDEALSGVSINMERRILKKMIKQYSNKTIIYISHRTDNLDLFDRFLKLDNGKIVLDQMRND